MKCEKCRWYRTTYSIYNSGIWVIVAKCLFGGCDGTQYEPRDEKDEVEE